MDLALILKIGYSSQSITADYQAIQKYFSINSNFSSKHAISFENRSEVRFMLSIVCWRFVAFIHKSNGFTQQYLGYSSVSPLIMGLD